MKKVLLSFLIVFLILVQVVFAQDFSIDVDMKPEYLATKTDYITLTINNPSYEDWFTINVLGVPQEWVLSEASLFRVPTFGSDKVLIKVSPSRDALPNIYQYFLKVVRVSTESTIEKSLLINVKQVTSAILKDVSLSCASCLDEVEVSGAVYNVGSKTVDVNLIIKIGNRQKTLNIGGIAITDMREFKETFSLEDMNPGSYNVDLNLVDVSGKSYYKEQLSFEIPVVEDVVYDQKVSSTPFGSVITLTAKNNGNVVSDIELKSVTPEGWYYYISGPTPSGMFLGKYLWETQLASGDTVSMTYSEIYWPTYILILSVVLASIFMYWQTEDLSFTKNIVRGRKFKTGREIAVSLNLKNRRKEVSRVTIRDLVPSNFSIISKFESVKPLIRKVANGVELFWNLGRLNPHEERVLHYTVKPVIETKRGVRLPSAIMKALRGRKFMTKYSNKVSLHPEKEEMKVFTVTVSK